MVEKLAEYGKLEGVAMGESLGPEGVSELGSVMGINK